MNKAVDELPVLVNISPSNETVRPISRSTERGVTSLGVSAEKPQKHFPSASANSTGTTVAASSSSSDRQQSVSFYTAPALSTAPVLALSEETPALMPEKTNMDLFEWPRLYFSMAKEENEGEFITSKNSSGKLPPPPPPPWPKMKPKTSNHLHQPESTTTNGGGNHGSNTNGVSSKNHGICGNSVTGGADVLLQWGQNKRSRGSRSENGSSHARQVIKIQRWVANGSEKLPSGHHLPQSTAGHSRGPNLRPCTALREVTTRNMDELPTVLNGATSSSNGRPPSRLADNKRASPSQMQPPAACPSLPTPANNGHHLAESSVSAAGEPSNTTTTPPEKVDMDLFEWPKIYISLSRKEKEDDFMAMKGTKLPQRPKRRAKIVDRNLQYCFPGMWLSDLTKGRYEVREKKCVKKKKRGLKGLESMDSGSE